MDEQNLSRPLWLSSPTVHEEELFYLKEALDTNWVSTVGKNIDEIERLFAALLGRRHAVALSSGTAALHMAVRQAGVRRGDPVLCSDLTFAATVNPILYEGGIPVLIDSERNSLNMDPRALVRALRMYPSARVAVAVNLYGTPARLEEIRRICRDRGVTLIEDAAESLGALHAGRQTGAFGDFSVLSFNGNKIITGSSGGMLLTDDGAAAAHVRKMATQSREGAPWYQHAELGYNYRMSNLTAGVVRGQLPHLNGHIAKKREIYERYRRGLCDLPVSFNPFLSTDSPNFWLTCLFVDFAAMCRQYRSDTAATYEKERGKSCPTEILAALSELGAEGRPI